MDGKAVGAHDSDAFNHGVSLLFVMLSGEATHTEPGSVPQNGSSHRRWHAQ